MAEFRPGSLQTGGDRTREPAVVGLTDQQEPQRELTEEERRRERLVRAIQEQFILDTSLFRPAQEQKDQEMQAELLKEQKGRSGLDGYRKREIEGFHETLVQQRVIDAHNNKLVELSVEGYDEPTLKTILRESQQFLRPLQDAKKDLDQDTIQKSFSALSEPTQKTLAVFAFWGGPVSTAPSFRGDYATQFRPGNQMARDPNLYIEASQKPQALRIGSDRLLYHGTVLEDVAAAYLGKTGFVDQQQYMNLLVATYTVSESYSSDSRQERGKYIKQSNSRDVDLEKLLRDELSEPQRWTRAAVPSRETAAFVAPGQDEDAAQEQFRGFLEEMGAAARGQQPEENAPVFTFRQAERRIEQLQARVDAVGTERAAQEAATTEVVQRAEQAERQVAQLQAEVTRLSDERTRLDNERYAAAKKLETAERTHREESLQQDRDFLARDGKRKKALTDARTGLEALLSKKGMLGGLKVTEQDIRALMEQLQQAEQDKG